MPVSAVMRSVLIFHLTSIFITDKILCHQPETRQETIKGIDTTEDPIELSLREEGSGEIESFDTTVFPGVVRADTSPHLVVKDDLEGPCLIATLNATMQVFYRVAEGIVHETYIAFAEIQLPEDVNARGVCGKNTSQLLLEWGNNTFHVNFTFTLNEPLTEDENMTWSMTDVAVSYDLSNQGVFPGTSETDVVTVEKDHLNLFTTPFGSTFECSRGVKVLAGTNERGVLVNFHYVKLAAFGVTSSEFPSGITECSEKEEYQDDEEILIPLIVACCLSVIVIIIVIAYVISRKVQASRDQSQYKQMP